MNDGLVSPGLNTPGRSSWIGLSPDRYLSPRAQVVHQVPKRTGGTRQSIVDGGSTVSSQFPFTDR
jgi:hypothetical protein